MLTAFDWQAAPLPSARLGTAAGTAADFLALGLRISPGAGNKGRERARACPLPSASVRELLAIHADPIELLNILLDRAATRTR